MPWLGRTIRAVGGGDNSVAVIRTAILSVLALLVFGLLFATGDAIVGHWLSLVLPDVEEGLVLRVFVAVAVTGVVLAAAYLALNPPALPSSGVRRPAQHRFEWLAPVLLVDAVFVLFLAAQTAVFFGGHDYIRSATGLTYAEYVHQGFGQLTFATALMLIVVWAASRKAGDTPSDQWWLRGSLGALCLLTLVVVASALYRMDLYQDAYGFTRLRLLVDLFEGWLGLVVLGVLVAGDPAAWLVAPADGPALRCGAAARARAGQPRCLDRAAQHRSLRDDRQGRLVLPPRAERRRGADAGSASAGGGSVCPGGPVARGGRLGRLEPLPRTRRRRPGRLRAAERRGLQ